MTFVDRHLPRLGMSLFLAVFSMAAAIAQSTVKGKVVDAETGESLIGATILISGTTQGTSTDAEGNFTLERVPEQAMLDFRFIGYEDYHHRLRRSEKDLGIIRLKPSATMLSDVIVTSTIAVSRKTPIAASTIDPVYIEDKLGAQEFPEILKATPGVYVIKQGGGFGDADVTVRGFESPNVAVMINGVPMNDMEWGGTYWSNWTGLADVIRSEQVQRGIGASKVSAPSVGGSINIITDGLEAKRGGIVSYAMGNDGRNKILFKVSSGISEHGWAFTLLGSRESGNGYVQGTEYEGYNYFVNIAKRLGDNHQLSLTAFGAPQWHNQRSNYDGLTVAGWQQVKNYMKGDSPYKYNPTYGFGLNGERKTSARNMYHKPQISLNHLWQITPTSSLSTALYTSIGRGYGYSGQNTSAYSGKWYGASNGSLNMDFRNPDGTFAYDQIYTMNTESDHGSEMVMSTSKNYHNWYGLLSTYENQLNPNWNVLAGVDFRYYKGVHTNEIIDLYGGDYYIDRYRRNVSASDYAGAGTDAFNYKKLQVGDVVYRDYDGYAVQEGAFAQAEYTYEDLDAFVSGSLNNTTYWRYDRFYYSGDKSESEKVSFIGWTAKAGANY
ncbi:MAG: TonB-dependent receptor, partial [Prevotellaceae bacterium]|nr:TonB-dependent receptor [Prevotellaceae bacterium]